MKSVIEDKFMFYAAMELRRQGVAGVTEWLTRIEPKIKLGSKVVPVEEGQPPSTAQVFTVNLSDMGIEDKVAVAIAETFIKLHMIEAQLQEVDQWRISLKGNRLTERSIHHLVLLTEICPKLTKLDVRGNQLPEKKQLELLQGVEKSQSVCVVYVDAFTTPEYAEAAALLKQRRLRSESMETARRSPSAISSSVATSRVSFASGNAEALRRRREELFSKNKRGKAPPSEDPSLIHLSNVEQPTEDDVVTPREAADDDNDDEVVEEETPQPPPSRRRTVSPSHVRDSEPADPPSPTPHAPGPKSSDIPRSREPFDEREDHLDLESNLNPLLDSMLNLSGVAEKDGQLRHPMIFGGAKKVWEIVTAYESAVEQSGLGTEVDAEVTARIPAALIGGEAYNALTVLNLSHNGLERLEVLPTSLLRLDISNNRLTSLEGLGQCKMLTVVNARRNEITEISHLERNLCLAHLFLGRNKIKIVRGLAHLLLLETLDLTYNLLRTQQSIRALSLCSSLHLLLLKGNPVIDKMNGRHIPVIRNLCPSLLVIDQVKLSNSRFADALLTQKNLLRQPERIKDSFQANAPNVSLIESRAYVDASVMSQGDKSINSASDSHSANILHLLTQGVTAATGYGDGNKVSQAAQQMDRTALRKELEEEKKKRARLTANGKNIRTEIVKQLAEESQRYLETTIVERLLQKQNIDSSATRNSAAVTDAEAIKCARLSPRKGKEHSTMSDKDLLKRYEPTKFKPPRSSRHTSVAKSRIQAPPTREKSPTVMDATLEEMYEVPTSYAALHSQERERQQTVSPSTASPSSSRSPLRAFSLRRSEPIDTQNSPFPPQERKTAEAATSPLPPSPPPAAAKETVSGSGSLKTVVHRDPSLGEWPPAKSPPAAGKRKYSAPPPLAHKTEKPKPTAYADSEKMERIQKWRQKLKAESDTVQEALTTLVTLLRTQCPKNMEIPHRSSELPLTYQKERQTCVEAISQSGLLEDTKIPLEVVVHYGFEQKELDMEVSRPASVEREGGRWSRETSEREDVLRRIRLMGDAKTCLRYAVMLINDGREQQLQEYVSQVLQHL